MKFGSIAVEGKMPLFIYLKQKVIEMEFHMTLANFFVCYLLIVFDQKSAQILFSPFSQNKFISKNFAFPSENFAGIQKHSYLSVKVEF